MLRNLFSRMRTLADWIGSPERARFRNVLNWIFLAGVIAYLFFQLKQIGWAEIWETRPTSPLFYLFVLLGYLMLPLADTAIYRHIWKSPIGETFVACLRKRIYNSAFVGYSGEVFLLVWSRQRVDRSDAQRAHEIKDTNILSALVSNYVTAGLLLFLLIRGGFRHPEMPWFDLWSLATLALAVLTPIAFLFRNRFMVLSRHDSWTVLAIHAFRFAMVQVFVLAQWKVELTAIAFGGLISLLAVQMLVSRIPFVPNRDLLFVSIGIALSSSMALPQTKIASLLVTTAALQQILHLVVAVVTSFGITGRGKAASSGAEIATK
ncbi:hypothetical protein [Novosphingopyxis sp. YJ-S2-01]|uniref:hypothetical protein n=1 Tax=Novosphingopyxis sp. YJ-S2-01 TaxID=2794021 RepID=UPI0018DE8945|nr:hypothetical protein [Novosphingopyxis sp. YJ-S2-01]MBH9536356.1 hypothetical protein [Novosphingopyxis sp. YJ-S2-01]